MTDRFKTFVMVAILAAVVFWAVGYVDQGNQKAADDFGETFRDNLQEQVDR